MMTPRDRVAKTISLWLYELVNMLGNEHLYRMSVQLHTLRNAYGCRAATASFEKYLPMILSAPRHDATCNDRVWEDRTCTCEVLSFMVKLQIYQTVDATRIENDAPPDWRPTEMIPEDYYAK